MIKSCSEILICVPERWYLMKVYQANQSSNRAGEQHFSQVKVASQLIPQQRCTLYSIYQLQVYTALIRSNKNRNQKFENEQKNHHAASIRSNKNTNQKLEKEQKTHHAASIRSNTSVNKIGKQTENHHATT